jgi:hypothetical protein
LELDQVLKDINKDRKLEKSSSALAITESAKKRKLQYLTYQTQVMD